jgi:hypothetical protein
MRHIPGSKTKFAPLVASLKTPVVPGLARNPALAMPSDDRTQCPGCRICPVVGAAGTRHGACSAIHVNTLWSTHACQHRQDRRTCVGGHSGQGPQLRFLCVSIARRPRRERSLIEESRRRISCPRLGAAPRASLSTYERTYRPNGRFLRRGPGAGA